MAAAGLTLVVDVPADEGASINTLASGFPAADDDGIALPALAAELVEMFGLETLAIGCAPPLNVDNGSEAGCCCCC